jgi:hypothetical protein
METGYYCLVLMEIYGNIGSTILLYLIADANVITDVLLNSTC